MSSIRNFVGAVGLVLSFNGAAAAQTEFNMMDWNRIQFDNLILQQPAIDALGEKQAGQGAADVTDMALTYKRDPQVSAAVISRIADELNTIEPGSGTLLSVRLGQMDVFALIGTEAERLGMDSLNVADAITMWMVNSWMILNRVDGDPSVPAMQAVSAQVVSVFGIVGDLEMTEAQRQELSEELLLRTVLASQAYEGLKGNPDALAGLDAQINAAARTMEFDFAQFDLTDAGFVPRQ
ncbi:MAG: DUF6683 family protein [Paracoccaceae bacterium]